MSVPIPRPEPTAKRPQHLCLDKGFDSPEVHLTVHEWNFTPHLRRIGEKRVSSPRRRGSRPRRWVVERTHSWFNRFRGVLIRWEKEPDNYKAMLHLAAGLVCFGRARRRRGGY
jgi:hypothetical protein